MRIKSSLFLITGLLETFTLLADAFVPLIGLRPTTSSVLFDSSTVDERKTSDEVEIPTTLPSAIGKDYVPLATMLATGDFKSADQVW